MATFVTCDCGKNPDCPECHGDPRGFRIESCPLDCITPDVTEFLTMMDYADAGTMPVLAGSRDQAHIFMEATAFIRSRMKDRIGQPEGDDE